MRTGDQPSFCRYLGGHAALLVHNLRAGRNNAPLHKAAKGDARRLTPGGRGHHGRFGRARLGLQPPPGRFHIGWVTLYADEVPVQPLGHRRRGAGAQKRVHNHIPRRGGGHDDTVQQCLRLLRGVQLQPVGILQPLAAGA